jgi:hypothetical protein
MPQFLDQPSDRGPTAAEVYDHPRWRSIARYTTRPTALFPVNTPRQYLENISSLLHDFASIVSAEEVFQWVL